MTDDGWEKVAAAPADDGWEPVPAAERPAPVVGEAIPEAFIGRLRAGEALGRVLQAAGKGASEGVGTGTPTGFSDDMLAHLIETGVFHDPTKGRAGPLQSLTEATYMPAAQLWEAISRATSAGIHGAGAAFGQLVDEVGGSGEPGYFTSGSPERAKNEVINAGNWLMIEAGMGRFARPSIEAGTVMDRTVGGLPTPEDFTAAGKVLESPHAEANLRQMWREDGIHPAEAVHDAQSDAFVKNEITAPREEIKLPPETEQVLEETGGKPGSLSAAMTEPGDIPLDVQPPRPPSSLVATAQAAAETLFDVGRDIQMKLAPMARGSVESMATIKDYMNAMRRNAWDVSRIDTDTMKRFDPEQRARLANAMEEESLSRRLGEPESAREHQGLATLTPEERAFVESENTRQQLAWLKARDLGMVEGDGIEMHYPRMVVGLPKGLDAATEGSLSITAIGADLRSRTPFMKQRKHVELEQTEKAIKDKVGMQLALQGKSVDEINAALEKVKVVRDIRAVNLATKQLEDAVAGRTLVENIKDVGKRTGDETVAVGFKPDEGWFTIDHPSFKQWRPKFAEVEGKVEAVKDSAGNPVFEQVPIYVRGDFEGPLRSAMWGRSGAAYQGLMALKGKTMGLIMNSPAIHNLVEFGRALPAMPIRMMTPVVGDGGVLSPVRIKVYADGFRAKNDPAVMHEAIDAGLVPIGKRFFNQDISAMMETPDLTPGRSITAKALALVPGLFDEGAGVAVKQAIDKAGDFWHNRLLWDKIADLQAGLYVNIRGDLVGKGMDQQTASRVAAHYANRYAGALPKEAMSEMATKVANTMLFSRSFTLGNLGVMKDMLTGLPKDVLAQIERDGGFRQGAISEAQILPELPKGLSLKERPNSVGNQEYSLVDAEGKEHYRASVSNGADDGFPGYHGVSWIENTSRDYTGVGPALYREIARSVENRGGKLLVGLSASAKAIKVHSELEKLGLAEPFDVNTLKPGLSAEIDAAEHMTGNRPNPMIVRSEPKPDTGVLEGNGGETSGGDAVSYAKSMARRKAISIVTLDVALMYAGNSILQSAFHVMLGQGGWSEEGHEYLRRLRDVVNDGAAHPLSLLNPLWIAGIPGRLSATADNEPGRQNRIMIGTAKDGTAIYARNPVGKIGDEFSGYFDGPIDMARKKEGTLARPLLQIYSNDAGFGRKVYDPHAETLSERAGVIGAIAKHLIASQLPVGQISAFSDLVKGEGDKFVNMAQALGPFAGVTFSKGAPGGPAVGEMYDAKSRYQFAVDQALPDIRKQIKRGDVDGAIGRMTELDVPQGLQRYYIKTTLNPALRMSPRAVRDFALHATPEQKQRFERARQAAPQ